VQPAPRGLTQWEYKGLIRNSINLNKMVDDLNILGRQGWEVIGFAGSDKTLGLNSIMTLLKRPGVRPNPPVKPVHPPGTLEPGEATPPSFP